MPVSVEGTAQPLYRWLVVPWLGGIVAYLGAVVTLGVLHGRAIVVATETLSLPAFSAAEWLSVSTIVLAGGIAFAACMAVYQAAQWRHLAAITRLDGRALTLAISTSAYVRMALIAMLLRIASLGLLGPVAHVMKVRFLLSRLHLAPAGR
jgi:uncharacterized membrane protein YjgN (DUF898 family)